MMVLKEFLERSPFQSLNCGLLLLLSGDTNVFRITNAGMQGRVLYK